MKNLKLSITSSILLIGIFTNFSLADTGNSTQDGFTFIWDTTTQTATLDAYTGAGGHITIPATVVVSGVNYKVTAIRDGDGSSLPGVFQGNSTITGITLPNTLTYIGDNTFVNANGLQGDLKIPASVVTIGTNAFSQQDQLTGRIEFEGALDGKSKLTTIRQNAFRRVQKAERTLIIPASVETIELSAFYQVGASGRLGSGLIFVGANDGTSHLSSIGSGTAGGFVGTFRYSAFSGKILFPASLLSISRGFIEVNDPVEVAFAAGSQLTTIGGGTFYNSPGITGSFTIPASVTFIENTAIYGTSISELIFEGAIPPTLGGINWTNTKNQMTIYYPECFSGNWLSGTTNWSTNWAGFSGYVPYLNGSGLAINYYLNGIGTDTTTSIECNQKASEPIPPTNADRNFEGRYTDTYAFANAYDFNADITTTNLHLFAKWTTTVSFNSNGGTPIAPQTVVKQHPLDISGYTEPTKTDYFFRGRYTDTELTQPFDIEYDRVMTGNLILYAKREKKPDPIIPSVPTPTPSSSGGGSSVTLQKDACPNGDFSASYYDKTCGTTVDLADEVAKKVNVLRPLIVRIFLTATETQKTFVHNLITSCSQTNRKEVIKLACQELVEKWDF